MLLKNLDHTETKTFRLHVLYTFIDGIAVGALLLNEFIFIKSLKGSDVQLAFLFQFSMVVFLFAMLANEIMRRYSNRKLFLRITGIVTRLPLVGLVFFPTVSDQGLPPVFHFLYLVVFLLYYTSKIAITPSINQYLRGSYKAGHFGRLFSYSLTVQKISTILSTFTTGLLLDRNPNSYKVFFPVIGVLGVISVFQLTRITFVQRHEIPNNPLWHSLGQSFKRVFEILKNNIPFKHLEIGFILYGFAWMSTHAVITIFYERVLHLNYSSVAFYNNTFNMVSILLLPVFGRLIGKKDPRYFAIITFGSLLFFIFFTGLTEYFTTYTEMLGIKIYYGLLIGTIFKGVFMGSMPILWGIGSSYFCEQHEAADYQSVHLFLTGARALVAPIIGIKLYTWFGFSTTYLTGIVFLLLAIGLMIYSARRIPRSIV